MSNIIPIDSVITLVRLRLYEATAVDDFEKVTPDYLAEAIGFGVTASFVRIALKQLKDLREVELEGDQSPVFNVLKVPFSATLTAYGSRMIEKDLSDPSSRLVAFQNSGIGALQENFVSISAAPASDRIVSNLDNQSEYDQAVIALDELKSELTTSNEAGDAMGDNRTIALAEVSAISRIISETRVRAEATLSFARKTLAWIIEKAGAASVAEIAKRALGHLINWLFS
ncbi:MAG: hypothetical protein IPH79_09105 [Sphingomonadales bacterium]|nr:hypothetical protein [Sphingomonadales bacterium]